MSFVVRSTTGPRNFSSSSSSGSSAPRLVRSSSSSMFAGSGGLGSRISVSSLRGLASNLRSHLDVNAGAQAMGLYNDKETMQGLNDRLAGYLGKVRGLEEANKRLEEQIRDIMLKRGSSYKDWSVYEKPLQELRNQISEMTLDNARLVLQIDNARLAADDFKVKWEGELAMRQGVEMDISGLRKVIDDTNVGRMQLENQIESLNEELAFLKKNHEEDVAAIKAQINDSSISVEMETPKGQDLNETINQIRSDYEKAARKSREDMDAWYQNKFDSLSAEVSQNTEALQTGKTELNELRRQKQGLEIDLQALHNMIQSLEGTLRDTENSYANDVGKLNQIIQQLEAELGQVRADMERQSNEYRALLNIKMKLESEINTYRQLLEGEDDRTKSKNS
ncbi:keratin, type I cytoskeletal 18 isoform X2 [Amia ocellicauda]|uniref:keratin, type I cytoskeletal 18 isoform X2 n=1 Tax=Amia ocellicauda TaxID=2972642 RepID=UPI003464962A